MFRISLVNMPFANLNLPSIGLTQLKSVIDERLGLGADQVNTADPISSYGLDSLSAIELSHNLE
jgi:acyl carrier protein